MLHIDAHTDTYPGHGSGERDRYNTATTFTRAAEEGLVDLANSYHVGARGPTYLDGVFEFTRQKGYRLIHGEDLFRRGFDDVLNELRARLAGRPVYLCFDMDFFDPSCAPGVCTPTWGGASSREGLALIKALAGLRFVGFEVNTVSPPHDVGGMTAFLAAAVVHQFLLLACKVPGMRAVLIIPIAATRDTARAPAGGGPAKAPDDRNHPPDRGACRSVPSPRANADCRAL